MTQWTLYVMYVVKEISDEKERIQTIYGLITRLPPANHDLLERLIFHLTRLLLPEQLLGCLLLNCSSVL